MKKFYLNIILFGIVFMMVLIIVEKALQYNTKTHIDLKFDELYHPKVKADMVIFGNSHAAHGINPKYMNVKNYRIYNFAFNGSNPTYYKKWYNNIFKPYYPKPKIIIYAVDWSMFHNLETHRRFAVDIRLMPLSIFWKELLYDKDVNKKTLISNRFNILFRPKQLQYIFYKKHHFDFVDMKAYYNGYVPHIGHKATIGESPETIHSEKKIQNDFDILLKEFKKDSIKVIFVNVPEYIPAWRTKGVKNYLNYLDSIAVVNNIPYLKYNQGLASKFNYDSTYFNNWIHLNDKGATVFSKTLSSDLNKIIQ